MKNILRPINPKDSNENKSMKKFQFKFNKKPWLIAGGVFAVLIVILAVLGYIFAYAPAMKIKAKGMEVADEAKKLQADIKLNDIDLIDARVNTLVEKYAAFEKESQSVYWATFIPYVADFKNGVEAGRYVIKAVDESVEAIYPYADLIGFKQGEQNFYDKSAEERLQTAVLTLDKMLESIDSVAKNIEEAEKRIEQIDPDRYPEKIGETEVRAQIIQGKDQFQGMASLFVDAKPLLKQLPQILGAEEEKNYLILFQNTAERRATGGFYTFFAVFNINKGKISIKDSSDIYDLDNSIAVHPAAPKEILEYHKNVTKFYLRDSNISPDFVKSVKLFDSLYQKSGRKVDYDGIIAMDSKVLVDMLRIFGDTQVNGLNFSAETDARCDCPQVIYSLFDIVDRPVNYVKVDRKRILGNLMLELFYKAVGFSPSKYWGQLAQTMFQNLDEKHILLYFTDKDAQTAVQRMNYAGRIIEVEGDYLHVNNVNFAGAKSNLFIDEELISTTTFEAGKVIREVTMKFKNPHPASDCNLERGGLCLNATLRNWIRFYVPKDSKLVSFQGSKTDTKTYEELDKTVFEGFMTVDPKGAATVKIKYELPSSIQKDGYKLYIQKQPGVQKQTLTVEIDGKKQSSALFTEDTVLE
ncbi:hypothetical protein COY16_01555 [Candidatus Roizmanbacteria bacterium CG_4_10_14_0_2_um_filter_39_13]|uniref:DUF4012 domain-containing protein n=1 Tax=Candidatus Roizmanbacteria bacterium CG_4_10_14_0_2_um_filter_39_13 TaxID=1974825 RepID=A0A2M7U0P1_9BACT|nr:MAG: hypothetical protein COY16_01555 [Candidatus Roizmanbacteria bacterium CG_4_10_14_0_2_um_filter_39_13]